MCNDLVHIHCYLKIIRGSHTFSITWRSSMCLSPVGRVLRSAHSPIISRSCSPPPTLKNWASRSFLGEVFILRLTKFTLQHAMLVFYCMFCIVVAVKTCCSVEYKLVNPFFNFHSPCLPHQNGVSHILHVQRLPIGSLFLSPLSHSRRNLARPYFIGRE